jgi:O-antigen/teichoic acid export membrane protein
VNAFLLRSGFLLAGLLIVTAPEFIRVGLGEKWLPMLHVFQLMLLFVMFDPIRLSIGKFLITVGRPYDVIKSLIIQVLVMILGIYTIGFLWGTIGVAVVINIVVLLGIVTLSGAAREYVDFSIYDIVMCPVCALVSGLVISMGIFEIFSIHCSDIYKAVIKIVMFIVVYGGLNFILERDKMQKVLAMMINKQKVHKHLSHGNTVADR